MVGNDNGLITLNLLQWLENDFIGYLNKWEDSAKSRTGFSEGEKVMMTLSRETSEGIRIAGNYIVHNSCLLCLFYTMFTVKSFCEMAQYLLQLPGVDSLLSNRLCCQDLLEQFFGKQRQRGATNDNPNIQQFECNTSAIRVASSIALAPVRGNCRGTNSKKRPGELYVASELELPLPKRPRYKKIKKST